jgi:hypothetical protein
MWSHDLPLVPPGRARPLVNGMALGCSDAAATNDGHRSVSMRHPQLHGADRVLVATLVEPCGLRLICRRVSWGQDGRGAGLAFAERLLLSRR